MRVKKVMIADDDPDILFALTFILEEAGYEVSSSPTGKYIMDGEYKYPDLYPLDKSLPDMDGLEICRQLRLKPTTRHIPVIIISASPKLKLKALEAGANGFLEKPFQMHELLTMLTQHLR